MRIHVPLLSPCCVAPLLLSFCFLLSTQLSNTKIGETFDRPSLRGAAWVALPTTSPPSTFGPLCMCCCLFCMIDLGFFLYYFWLTSTWKRCGLGSEGAKELIKYLPLLTQLQRLQLYVSFLFYLFMMSLERFVWLFGQHCSDSMKRRMIWEGQGCWECVPPSPSPSLTWLKLTSE